MNTKPTYFPNIDGLRFFCFFVIFVSHWLYTEDAHIYYHPVTQVIQRVFHNAGMGVNCFFTLSGFLITYLLLLENDRTGTIKIGWFYQRRALRIWPLYFLMVFLGFAVLPFAKKIAGISYGDSTHLLYYLTFLNNFDIIHNAKLPEEAMLMVLWSLAIEEQFYLVWPLVFFLFRGKKLLYVGCALVVFSCLFRFYHKEDSILIYFHTFSAMSDMVMGAMAACVLFRRPSLVKVFSVLGRPYILLIYVGFFAVFLFRDQISSFPVLFLVERPLISFGFLMILFEQSFAERSLFKLSNYSILTYLGQISFGLYCYHNLVIYVVRALQRYTGFKSTVFSFLFVEPLITLFVTIAIAHFSFQGFEKPFLRLKKYAS